jgi:hypothetical protein
MARDEELGVVGRERSTAVQHFGDDAVAVLVDEPRVRIVAAGDLLRETPVAEASAVARLPAIELMAMTGERRPSNSTTSPSSVSSTRGARSRSAVGR